MFVELLPVPLNVDAELLRQIESNVIQLNEKEIDDLIYSLYGISSNEILYIESLL